MGVLVGLVRQKWYARLTGQRPYDLQAFPPCRGVPGPQPGPSAVGMPSDFYRPGGGGGRPAATIDAKPRLSLGWMFTVHHIKSLAASDRASLLGLRPRSLSDPGLGRVLIADQQLTSTWAGVDVQAHTRHLYPVVSQLLADR